MRTAYSMPRDIFAFARAENYIAFFAICEQFLATYLGGRAEALGPEELSRSTAQILEGSVQH